MIAVSDSSPLIALARIGRLNLLAELYGRILIPAEVHNEVTIAGRGVFFQLTSTVVKWSVVPGREFHR